MQLIGGSSLPQDVILEQSRELLGDILAIHLSQDPSSVATWNFTVFVHTSEGEMTLGSFTSTAPGGLQPAARVVGFAFCPGAIGWKVVARSSVVDDVVDVILTSSKGSGPTFGVTKNATFL